MNRNLAGLVLGLSGCLALPSMANAQWSGTWKANSTYLSRLTTSSNWKLVPNATDRWYYKGGSSRPSPNAEKFLYAGTSRYRVEKDGVYPYQCVDFVKDLAKNVPTSRWGKGTSLVYQNKIRTGIPAGTVFASFTNGAYDHRHTFIFLARLSATQILVADQNWDYKEHIWKHKRIRVGGTNTSNAAIYYAVKDK